MSAGVPPSAAFSPLFRRLLAARGLSSPEAAEHFLFAGVSSLADPFAVPGMARACERFCRALDAGERIGICGHDDADAISSAFLLHAFLAETGTAPACVHLMDGNDPYDFGAREMERFAMERCSLLAVVDWGVNWKREAFDAAAAAGIDIVVLDHHTHNGGDLPGEHVFVDPLLHPAAAPYHSMSAAGIVFFFLRGAAALRPGHSGARACEMIEMAALGTIADNLPLTGENRIIVREGLRRLDHTAVPGLRRLIERAGVGGSATCRDLTFKLIPKLNSPGRFHEPETVLDLLRARDDGGIDELIRRIEALDRRRYTLVADMQRKIEHEAATGGGFVSLDGFPSNLCGLLAMRFSRLHDRPVLVCAPREKRADRIRGSARGPRWCDLRSAMARIQSRCEEFGGHTHAVGLEFDAARLAEIERMWVEDVAVLRPSEVAVPADMEIGLEDLTPAFLREVRLLEPFGPGNREPVFLSRNLSVQGIVRQERGYRRFWVRGGAAVAECRIAVERDSASVVPGAAVDVRYTAHLAGESMGLERVRIEAVACSPAGNAKG